MLTKLGFGKEFAQVSLYCDNTVTAARAGKPLLQFQDESHRFALLLHPRASVGRMYFDKLHLDRQQPCQHRHETPEQASLQASAGPHQKFRRQQHQEIVLYVCVFVY